MHGPLGEAVPTKYLLYDRPVHADRRGETGLDRRADRVEPHGPVPGVVQARELVPLAVPDLQAAHAVGRAGPGRHKLLVDGGVDPLQHPQDVALDLDGAAAQRVQRHLLKQRHPHALGVARHRNDQSREPPPP